jgi:lauroyl/myristoyl acyltransferase
MNESYVQAFERMIRLARWGNGLPWTVRKRCGAWLGRRYSFLRLQAAGILDNLCTNLDVPRSTAEAHLDALCASSGVAFQMTHLLAGLPDRWIADNVRTEQAHLLDRVRTDGGVILSHHSFHQNLLAACLKHWGLATCTLANDPSILGAGEMYRFTAKLNRDTESNLNGGRFLYVHEGRELVRSMRDCLRKKLCMLLFCDFNEAKPFNRVHPFLRSRLQPPSGVVSYAHRHGSPFYFAGFRLADDYTYRLYLEDLDAGSTGEDDAGAQELMRRYLAALERHVRLFPSAWQTWEIL